MDIKNLILEAYENGIHLVLKEGALVAKTKVKMSGEMRTKIKANKAEIISYLQAQQKHLVSLNNTFAHIPKAQVQNSYPIPTSLYRIWVLSQFEQGNVAYNMPGAIELKGDFQLSKFEAAFQALIERHEILRTVFKEDELGDVRQFIKTTEELDFKITLIDLSQTRQQEAAVRAQISKLVVQPFDLGKGPLLSAHVFRLAENRQVFFFNMHHIINDGWSMEVFINELFELYNAQHQNRASRLPDLSIQYKDYAVWHAEQLEGKELEAHRNYWLSQFEGEIPVLDFPASFTRPSVQTYNGSVIRTRLSKAMTQQLHDFVTQRQGTPFMGLLAAVYAIVHRYTGQEDLVIGSPTAGRTHVDLESQLGFYVNTLALRARINGENNFTELFDQVRKITFGAFDHQIYPIGDLIDALDLPRDISRSPLFNIMLVLHNNEAQSEDEELGGLEIKHYDTDYVTSKYELSFYFKEVDGQFLVTIEYNTDIFSAAYMQQMAEHFDCLLGLMLQDPTRPLASLDILNSSERKHLLEISGFHDIKNKAPKNLVSLFKERVRMHPDQIALVAGEVKLTYQKLDEQSNQLANFLSYRYGVETEELIGVLLEHGIHYPVAVLGILKAGAAYVPIESNYPISRMQGMIEDANIRLVITQDGYNEIADQLQWKCSHMLSYLSLDNDNVYNETEIDVEKASQELWDYISTNAEGDLIKGGGWFNSYSQEPFSVEEMSEFTENVLEKVKAKLSKEKKVLEIGCGSGLIMRKIAPQVATYVATDISPKLVTQLQADVHKEGFDNVKVQCLTATEVGALNIDDFDLIILNSVVQYFSGFGYLRKVIEQCLDILAEEGTIFLGDIMDLGSRDALIHDHVEYKKIHKDAKTKLDFNDELFLPKNYFEHLLQTDPRIKYAEVSDKIYTIENELTKFRYDASLQKGNKGGQNQKVQTYRFYQKDLIEHSIEYNPKDIPANHLAYVTFTSGSSGRPKGVMISHGNVSSFLKNYESVFRITPEMKMGALTNISFDISVLEIIGALCSGLEIILLAGNNPTQLAKETRDYPLDVLQLTPSRLQQLFFVDENILKSLQQLKVLLIGGEAFPQEYFNLLKKELPQTHILNVYGPTETTVWSSSLAIHEANQLSIGKRLLEEQIFILNDYGLLQPKGVAGEICIGGAGLSRGYLNKPQLTVEKFSTHPFNEKEKIYKTGDLGRYLRDGQIEFISRKDDQIKLRGHRIELGEIENVLLKYAGVEGAVALLTENSGEKKLIAVLLIQRPLPEEEIRDYLKNLIPYYMIPATFYQMESLPLLASGKVNRKALLAKVASEKEEERIFVKPRNETDKKLVKLWSEVLGLDGSMISIEDNFFRLGGHSLKATRLMSLINKEFGVSLLLNKLFTANTITTQTALISNTSRIIYQNIPRLPKQAHYELSSSQMRLWILSQFEAGNIAYNMPGVFVLEGALALDHFVASFQNTIKRHEILRTVFRTVDGMVRQFILDAETDGFQIPFVDLRMYDQPEAMVEKTIYDLKTQAFDLAQGPLLNARLFQLEKEKHVFFFNMHHIISDGWSMEIFLKEILINYNALVQGLRPSLPQLAIQYKDYAAWQRQQLEGENLERHKNYWLDQFSGELPVLELPEEFPRPEVMTYVGAEVKSSFSKKTSSALKALVQQKEGTLFMGLVAGINALLYHYTGAEDIILGTPIAGREHLDLNDQIGFYINTLALRTRFSAKSTFEALVQEVKTITLEAYDHQVYPFDELIDHLKLDRDVSRSPLFNIMVILQNNESYSSDTSFQNLKISTYDTPTVTSKFELSFIFTEVDDQIHYIIEYNNDIYSELQINTLCKHFNQLMTVLATNAGQVIQRAQYLQPAERKQVLLDFNQTDKVFEKDKTILDLFSTQVTRRPEQIALTDGFEQLTYVELDRRTNQFAAYLKTKYPILADDLIGIQMPRSNALLVVMLGILKAGAAYLPIDPGFPKERINYILEDSQVRLVITEKEVAYFFNNQNNYPETPPSQKPLLQHLAYVTYTSGSTGKPKGVMIEHRSVSAFLQNFETVFALDHQAVMAATTNITFDISVLELLGTIGTGGTCYMMTDPSLEMILDCIEKDKITALQVTPSRLKQFFEYDEEVLTTLKRLKILLVGGEALNEHLYQKLTQLSNTRVFNVYGPTEATIWSTSKEVMEGTRLSIGTPLLNEKIYILNEQLNPVAPCVKGELYIAGSGLARGYLNREQLTSERFIQSPFDENKRLYKTGDIGYWTTAGEIEFIGRKDEQIKIRGYRIELGEVETVLQNYPNLDNCIIKILRKDNANDALVAYVLSKQILNAKALRTHMSQFLPAYMIPSYFVQLDELPLLPSGKINTKMLPDPSGQLMDTGVEFELPQTTPEKEMRALWAAVLDLKEEVIGINDNFFDLGGNSIKAIQLLTKVNQQYSVKLSTTSIFQYSCIKEFTDILENTSAKQPNIPGLVPLQTKGNARPLFMVAGTGGFVMGFFPLVQALDNQCPLYGLEPKGIDGTAKPFDTVEALAAYYIKALQTVQPHGPYQLLGHSFGAFVVYEMVRQLEVQGEMVDQLFILDTGIPSEKEPQAALSENDLKLGLLHTMLQYFDQDAPVEDTIYLKQSTAQQHQLIQNLLAENGVQLSMAQIQGYANTFIAQGSTNYVPEHYLKNTQIVLFKTAEMEVLEEKGMTPALGWDRLCETVPVVYKVPGSHITMLHHEHVSVLAEKLQKFLIQKEKEDRNIVLDKLQET